MAATYTNFCCRSGGSNLNAGTRTGDTTEPGTGADFTYASGTWVASTGVFTVASGNPSSDGVAVGDFASVYADGSTVTGFVGRVTARDATTITVSLTAKSGTAPADGTTNTTAKIGGAWAGPSGASAFPVNFLLAACMNAANNPTRLNFKNDQTYSITATMTYPSNGWRHWAGYTTSYGDGGAAIIDGGTSGASYTLFNSASTFQNNTVEDLIVRNNGATGGSTSIHGFNITANGNIFRRLVFHDLRASGFTTTTDQALIECEFYACNQSNTAGCGGVRSTGGVTSATRCMFHDQVGNNAVGMRISGAGATLIACVFDTNAGGGLSLGAAGVAINLYGCDFYNNGVDGITSSNVSFYAENCNFIKNTGWAVNNTDAAAGSGIVTLVNCGFGSGTQANTSGNVHFSATSREIGSVTYAADVTPWVDPANGDFRINLAAAVNSGRGTFLETALSYFGTQGFPCIGAAQPAAVDNSSGVIFQPLGSLGSGSNKVNQTTITVNSAITMTAGQMAIVVVGTDNDDAADGQTSLHVSVTIGGHGCTKLGEFTNAQGAAGAGATVSVWYLIAPSDIAAASAIVATASVGKDAKAVTAYVLDWDTTYTPSLDGLATLANDGGDPGSMSATGTLDVPHLWIRGIALEESDTTVGAMTPTAAWTSIVGAGAGAGTTGGAAASNISVRAEIKVASGTGSGTSDPTAVAADCASLLVGIAASLEGGLTGALVGSLINAGMISRG